jgi:hypothetical protein
MESFLEWLKNIDQFVVVRQAVKNTLLENFDQMVLYHGSYDKVSKFEIQEYTPRTDWGYYGLGVYLTPNPGLARYYGPNVHECKVNLKNPLLWSGSKEELYEKYPSQHKKGTRDFAAALTKSMISDGHDGIISIHPGSGMGLNRGSEFCVFDPNDIEVLTPTWDMEKADGVVADLRKQIPFFSKDQYDSFSNNWPDS